MSEPHFDIEREQWRKACRGPAPNIGARFGSRKRKLLFEDGDVKRLQKCCDEKAACVTSPVRK